MNEGGCRLSFVNRDQNVYVEELNESGRELRLLTGDDRVESAAPQTCVEFHRSAERRDARVVNNPSNTDRPVVEPDARGIAHAFKGSRANARRLSTGRSIRLMRTMLTWPRARNAARAAACRRRRAPPLTV